MTEGQTVLALDEKDIAIVVKEDGTHEVYISSKVDEEEETEQNFKVVLVLAVLLDPEKYAGQILKDLEKYSTEK